jgi:DNA topoisomerase VI subunit B
MTTIIANGKCKNPATGSNRIKQAFSRLDRTTFHTSREMDFFSERELVTQTGHDIREWPLVILKELIDNSLDACEDADIAPCIEVSADATGITVKDNGPGLPESTLQGALDFKVRVSNREAYVSPCRGAQGNALKTLLPMPYVIDPGHGKFIVEAQGKRHVITCGADPISQEVVINDEVRELRKCRGTLVRLEWEVCQNCEWPFDHLDPLNSDFVEDFRRLAEGFTVFNPHATISLDWFGSKTTWKATNPSWRKWKPCYPTSPHWYEIAHLERLIGAYITHDRKANTDRLVSDFVAEFDGLTGSQKRAKVLADADMKRVNLAELVVGDRLDSKRIEMLLAAMQRHTRPVKSERLGIIGEDHLKKRLLAMGVKEESFRYSRKIAKCKKRESAPDEKACFIPWVLESAFGWRGNESEDMRRIFSGANWSSAIKNPFRSFGSTGEGLETALSDIRATRFEPIVFVLHLAHPRVQYTDRGKSALVVEGSEND